MTLEQNIPMSQDCDRILISTQELDAITTRLANEIQETYQSSPRKLVLVVILKGSITFAADLMRKIQVPVQLEFMRVSSYGASTKQSGEIRLIMDLERDDLPETDLLVVEDIIDSGRTLSRLTQLLKNRNAGSIRTCTLLDKPSRREVDFTPDFCGAQIPDEFVVGYGLDYAEDYRHLPYVGVLKRSVYSHN